ncbi:AraC family transcriptional regulator [Paenibacillus sp. IB182496]|uniref:AraC family transcriptional regulator n=1 Tax=Paenibacillus sabuli TaxID=2772509 RepID=A0A927BWL1_9BACL|nr:AraC family transcriptional regulator [Paenibacillus sabuli]MBD2847657.1 AraC family transcriptional regulator [Paenibacillus sabuli]
MQVSHPVEEIEPGPDDSQEQFEPYSRLERTARYMRSHYKDPITREKLAEIAGLNPEHYSRRFRHYAGVSPMQYLTNLRIETAKRLLRAERHSIAEVARLVGYADPYHFSRRFKQATGRSPSRFKQEAVPRVLALAGRGHCLALGVEPVAWAQGQSDAATDPYDGELSLDLIITADAREAERWSAVAEVAMLDPLDDPITTQLQQIARMLGRKREADDWTTRYTRSCERLREKLSATIGDERVAVLRVREQLLQIYGTLNIGYVLYRSLRLRPPERVAVQSLCNAHFHSSVITPAELAYYDAEHLFVLVQPDEGALRRWKEIEHTAQWREFTAVRRGNVHQLAIADWLDNDPSSLERQAQEAAEILLNSR